MFANKKYRNLVIINLLLILLIATSSCGKEEETKSDKGTTSEVKEANLEDKINKINEEETYPEAPGSLEDVFNDIESIKNESDQIIKCKVKDVTVETKDDLPQSISKISVLKTFKGTLKEEEEISVIEEGGSDGKVLGNIPQLSKDHEYYLFLNDSDGKYFITGAFQGRFIVREAHVFQQATEDVKLKDYKPLSSKDFEELLK